MQSSEFNGGILFEIEAHLAPLGWHFEEMYENSDLLDDLTAQLRDYQSRDRWYAHSECYYGMKFYKEEQNKLDLRILTQRDENNVREYRNADRRSKVALKSLTAIRNARAELSEAMEELKAVLVAMKTANRHQSRLPSYYSEEALLS